jgi:hypothetical protein
LKVDKNLRAGQPLSSIFPKFPQAGKIFVGFFESEENEGVRAPFIAGSNLPFDLHLEILFFSAPIQPSGASHPLGSFKFAPRLSVDRFV